MKKKKKWVTLLIVLIIIACGCGYIYFNTDLIYKAENVSESELVGTWSVVDMFDNGDYVDNKNPSEKDVLSARDEGSYVDVEDKLILYSDGTSEYYHQTTAVLQDDDGNYLPSPYETVAGTWKETDYGFCVYENNLLSLEFYKYEDVGYALVEAGTSSANKSTVLIYRNNG